MATETDFVDIDCAGDMQIISRWFAERRILYEYPEHDRNVFGSYDEQHIGVIQRGILGELAVFQYLHEHLLERYGDYQPEQRHNLVRDKLCLRATLGCFDPGIDMTVGNFKVDVKSYATALIDRERILTLNLLINRNQLVGHDPADIYVQTFFTADTNVVLAGWYNHKYHGLPRLNHNLPSPAYACPVRDLDPMSTLIQLMDG